MFALSIIVTVAAVAATAATVIIFSSGQNITKSIVVRTRSIHHVHDQSRARIKYTPGGEKVGDQTPNIGQKKKSRLIIQRYFHRNK
jgi:hypothetical protein